MDVVKSKHMSETRLFAIFLEQESDIFIVGLFLNSIEMSV